MKNLITDVPGVLVGHADDARLASGVTVVLFEAPAAGGMATPGGAPALREGALMSPEMTVERIDAFVLAVGRLGVRARRGWWRDGASGVSGARLRQRRRTGCRSRRARRYSISTTAATKIGARARPMAISAMPR